jgi:predicted nucleic acid-binding protein
VDVADTPHVALALELNGLLWTGDRALRQPSLPSLSETVTFRVVLSLEGEEETVCCRIGTGMEPTAVA